MKNAFEFKTLTEFTDYFSSEEICREDFTIKTKTVFGESKIALRKWFMAIYLLSTSGKGISSVQLAKQVGVTQKTGWFIDHRIREAMQQNGGQLFGTIE